MIISTAQTKPTAGNIEHNICQHLELLELATQVGSDVIVFPELSITGYEPTLANELATTHENQRFNVFQQKSDLNNITIIIGCPIQGNNGIHIGSVIFQPNIERKVYLKKYLFHSETPYFKSGEAISTFEINKYRIAPAICYEISVKEHQECAYANHAELYLASVVEDEQLIPNAFEKMSNTSKAYNMVSLMSNCIGISGGYQCGGNSAIWNENGDLIEKLNSTQIGVLSYNIGSKEYSKQILDSKELAK